MKSKTNALSTILSFILFISIITISCQQENSVVPNNPSFDIQRHNDSLYQAWDSIRHVLRDDIINDLHGKWTIDSLEIKFENSYANEQTGIQSDTTFIGFGEIEFGTWESVHISDRDDTNFKNKATLHFKGQAYTITFDYLLYNTDKKVVFSFISNFFETGDNWGNSDGWFLRNIGILDNVEIKKINNDEYNFTGLDSGLKKMKMSRK